MFNSFAFGGQCQVRLHVQMLLITQLIVVYLGKVVVYRYCRRGAVYL